MSVDGIWKIPAEKQEKGMPGEFSLSDLSLEVFRAQNCVENNPYIFAFALSAEQFSRWSPTKRVFD